MAFKNVKYVRWIRCQNCTLQIVVQVGDDIPAAYKATCPRCGVSRIISRGDFLSPNEISADWKKEVKKSIGENN